MPDTPTTYQPTVADVLRAEANGNDLFTVEPYGVIAAFAEDADGRLHYLGHVGGLFAARQPHHAARALDEIKWAHVRRTGGRRRHRPPALDKDAGVGDR